MKVNNAPLTSHNKLFPTVIWQIVFEYALTFGTVRSSIPQIKTFLLELTGTEWKKILSSKHHAALVFERLSSQQVYKTAYLYNYVSATMWGVEQEIKVEFFTSLHKDMKLNDDVTDLKEQVRRHIQTDQTKLEKKESYNTISFEQTHKDPLYHQLFINMISLLSSNSIDRYLSSHEPYSNRLLYLFLYISPICKLVNYHEKLYQYYDSFFQEIKTNIMRSIKEQPAELSNSGTGLAEHRIIETYFQP